MRIGVYTIAKNEKKNVSEWLDSVQDADTITFVDTGSTDHTVETLYNLDYERYSRPVDKMRAYKATIDPWRFDTAHNTALSLVPADTDVCIPLHLDERLMPGWRDVLESKWVVGETTKAFYTYVFSHNPDGSPELSFMQNRIHARRGYIWRYPDHEGVYPYQIQEQSITIPELRIEQWQDRSRDHGSGVLERLILGLQEHPNDARMLFYLGREYYYRREYKFAIPLLEQYFKIGPTFATERAEAASVLSRCWKALS